MAKLFITLEEARFPFKPIIKNPLADRMVKGVVAIKDPDEADVRR